MISLNKAMIIGNATKDPELRYTPNGKGVCNFSVATNRRYKNASGELQEDTQYHEIVAWGKLAELINQFIKKGNRIFVEGRLQTRQWEAPDGGKRYRTEIIMEQFVPLTPKGSSDFSNFSSSDNAPSDDIKTKKTDNKTTNEDSNKSSSPEGSDEIDLDDIPF